MFSTGVRTFVELLEQVSLLMCGFFCHSLCSLCCSLSLFLSFLSPYIISTSVLTLYPAYSYAQYEIRGQLVQDVIENKAKDLSEVKEQLNSSRKYAADITTQLTKAQTNYQV